MDNECFKHRIWKAVGMLSIKRFLLCRILFLHLLLCKGSSCNLWNAAGWADDGEGNHWHLIWTVELSLARLRRGVKGGDGCTRPAPDVLKIGYSYSWEKEVFPCHILCSSEWEPVKCPERSHLQKLRIYQQQQRISIEPRLMKDVENVMPRKWGKRKRSQNIRSWYNEPENWGKSRQKWR